MIKLFIGAKGSGKTKTLIELVNSAASTSKGSVVCIEKGDKLIHDVTYKARLIDTDDYAIYDAEALYGFISGILASNSDITDIFVDATLRIGGRDYEELGAFLAKVNELSKITEHDITFTVSADKEEIPASVFDFAEVL